MRFGDGHDRSPPGDDAGRGRRPARRRIGGALAVATALIAAACSDGDDAGERPTTAAGSPATEVAAPAVTGDGSAAPAALIDDLDVPGAVQDFAVIIDMRRHDGDESVSFYADVLAAAASGAGRTVTLEGGFSFAPVAGLEASAVDADGAPLDSISIDHGLLTADDATMEYPIAAAAWLLAGGGAESSDFEPAPALLVEIATADYTTSITHVQPGDRSRIDLSSVESIAPGDDLEMIHLFGQTYPGDPAGEAGLGPHELFVRRWNDGRLRFLGAGPLPFLHADRSIEAIDGSTILTRDQKLAVVRAREQEAALADLVACEDDRCTDLADRLAEDVGELGMIEVDVGVGGRRRLVPVAELPGGEFAFIVGGVGDTFRIHVVARQGLPWLIRTVRAYRTCLAAAEELNEANASNGIGTGELTPFERFVAGVDPEPSATTVPATVDPAASTTAPDDEPPEPDDPAPIGCDPPDPDRGPLDPPPRFGLAYGDLHLSTFDGRHYENQAAGEFVLVEDPPMQIRTEPWDGGAVGVSVATAFAADVDGHRVAVHLDGATWIDDEAIEPPRGEVVAVGGGELLWWGDGWLLRWPDGTLVRIDRNVASLVVVVEPVGAPAAGLLGDGDGDPTNDFVTRAGDPLAADADADRDRFTREFLDSWRISAGESLFHYAAGESTDTFTIEGFPEEPVTIDALPASVARSAETRCRLLGLRDGAPLDACILDVGATGEIAFAEDAHLAQTVIAASSVDQPLPPSSPPDGGTANALRFGATTIAFGPEPPTVAPNSPAPSWECEADESSLFAISSFRESADRSWEITIRYLGPTGGAAREELTVRVDLNGAPHAWVNPAAHFADAVDAISFDGRSLVVEGRLYVNEPPVVGLGPVNALPDGAELTPFRLTVECAD